MKSSMGNLLLARLPLPEQQRLLERMRPVSLELRKRLYTARSRIDSAYFLDRGIASAMTVMDDGSAIEVATIGHEGVVGLEVLFAGGISSTETIMQIAGDGFSMEAEVFVHEAREGTALRRLIVNYNAALQTQIAYTVACNALHNLLQRCCRWILITHDRLDSDDVPLTHEFLAVMLGVRRASVTEALKPLQEQGLVRTGRGTITIVDRAGLQKLACECYGKVKAEFDRLLDA